jgi:hypothetical protein
MGLMQGVESGWGKLGVKPFEEIWNFGIFLQGYTIQSSKKL